MMRRLYGGGSEVIKGEGIEKWREKMREEREE